MTTKIIYIAEDGEEFETSDECLKYESKRNATGAVLMFAGNRLPIVDTDSVTAFEDATYLYILNAEKAKAFFDYISEAYGMAVPNPEEVTDHALYSYEDRCGGDGYIDLNGEIAELEVLRDELLDRARECLFESVPEWGKTI